VLALSLVAEAARVMAAGGDRGMDPAAYARRRRVPARFLNVVVDELVRGGLLAELAPDKGRYVLLRAPAALTAGAVMDCVLTAGVDLDDLGLREVEPAILKLMARADTTFAHALGTTKVADLV
jgi:DNA-binding IscR family transcriptional regulator